MVFNLLNQRYDSLYYLKDILEIDFYADNTLYQVSYNIDDSKTKKREISAIENFKKVGKKYKLITYNENDIIGDIEVVSFDEFAI
ncbi:ATPase [sediment metagenome]|uniref:ATPase n=1 Tax=sediment metagenome TaxID=749907 RepID=D9PHE8_9ZZZZ